MSCVTTSRKYLSIRSLPQQKALRSCDDSTSMRNAGSDPAVTARSFPGQLGMPALGGKQLRVRRWRIDQGLGERDLIGAREADDVGLLDGAPRVLAHGGRDISGQSQAA